MSDKLFSIGFIALGKLQGITIEILLAIVVIGAGIALFIYRSLNDHSYIGGPTGVPKAELDRRKQENSALWIFYALLGLAFIILALFG